MTIPKILDISRAVESESVDSGTFEESEYVYHFTLSLSLIWIPQPFKLSQSIESFLKKADTNKSRLHLRFVYTGCAKTV